MIEKESKKTSSSWVGKSEGSVSVIFSKKNEKIHDIVDVLIQDAQGMSMFGSRILDKDAENEIN